jgi:hypothetical protein
VRIAFDDGPIHERARVAFVGVADQVLLVAIDLAGELPFLAVGKPAAAAAAQPALFDHGVAAELPVQAGDNLRTGSFGAVPTSIATAERDCAGLVIRS